MHISHDYINSRVRVGISTRKPGEYDLTSPLPPSAQGREFKVFKEREGKKERTEEKERKGGRKEKKKEKGRKKGKNNKKKIKEGWKKEVKMSPATYTYNLLRGREFNSK